MAHVERIRVRYHECDMQNVVFNANYWMYADDAVAQWMHHSIAAEMGVDPQGLRMVDVGFDFMLKTASGTWHRPARYGDTIDAACAVSRWGNTSFDVDVAMTVAGESVFDATITYVSTTPGAAVATPVPDMIKRALSRD